MLYRGSSQEIHPLYEQQPAVALSCVMRVWGDEIDHNNSPKACTSFTLAQSNSNKITPVSIVEAGLVAPLTSAWYIKENACPAWCRVMQLNRAAYHE